MADDKKKYSDKKKHIDTGGGVGSTVVNGKIYISDVPKVKREANERSKSMAQKKSKEVSSGLQAFITKGEKEEEMVRAKIHEESHELRIIDSQLKSLAYAESLVNKNLRKNRLPLFVRGGDKKKEIDNLWKEKGTIIRERNKLLDEKEFVEKRLEEKVRIELMREDDSASSTLGEFNKPKSE
jgi:hypothetical protein